MGLKHNSEVLRVAENVESLKEKARTSFEKGKTLEASLLYGEAILEDPLMTIHLAEDYPEEVFLRSDIPDFKNKYQDFAHHKKLIDRFAENLGIEIDERSFGPIEAYKDFWKLFKRSVKKKEVSGALTYGFCMVAGMIPPYADFRDFEQDNLLDKFTLRPKGLAVSPLAPLVLLNETATTTYTATFLAYMGLMHGYYSGTKHGRFRMLGHEYTHFHQMLVTQRMYADGYCSDVNGFLDQAYDEFEALSADKAAIKKDLEAMTPSIAKLVMDYELAVKKSIKNDF